MHFRKVVKDSGEPRIRQIDTNEAVCKNCTKIIEKYDEMDPYGLAFEEGKKLESKFEKEYEAHMRIFHRMIR